ncbi:hypothetical protein [Nocardioides sp. KR10-350]|uniref:hypothetical protein n=1 Tax=Nocardioides cheoyonin TaxID=3156615 RepID=UPI0032B47E3D
MTDETPRTEPDAKPERSRATRYSDAYREAHPGEVVKRFRLSREDRETLRDEAHRRDPRARVGDVVTEVLRAFVDGEFEIPPPYRAEDPYSVRQIDAEVAEVAEEAVKKQGGTLTDVIRIGLARIRAQREGQGDR